jgi:hypothetical protein
MEGRMILSVISLSVKCVRFKYKNTKNQLLQNIQRIPHYVAEKNKCFLFCLVTY